MTGEQRTLAIWGGAAGAVAVIGLAWVVIRGGSLSDDRARITQLSSDYAKAQPAGAKLESQIAAMQKAAQEQGRALDEAARTLAPELKAEYRASDLTSAANRVATDLKALRQRAERTRVALPASLPLEGGLDPDENVRQQQLAQLSLVRSALDTVMDAGVARIAGISPGKPWADPSGAYAVFPADIDIEAPFEAVQAVLQGFLAAHKQGLGLRGVTLTPNLTKPDGPVRAKLTVSLVTVAKPEWKLAPDKTAPKGGTPAAKPATATAAAPAAAKPTTASSKPSLGDD